MRKNSTDFSTPQRQSIEGVVLNIYKTLNLLIRKILPAFFVLLVGSKQGKLIAMGVIAVFAVIGIVTSIIKYFRYSFYIEEDNLIVTKGVFSQERLSIPFDRIQSVNFEQNVIHQALEVVAVKIDSAGSKGSEIEMSSLKHEVAMALRDKLLSKKMAKYTAENEQTIPEEEVLLKLSFDEILKAGVVENHFKSMGLLVATVLGLYENVKDLGFEKRMDDNIESFSESMTVVVIIALLVLLISFIISVIRMILVNYDLKFTRILNGFKIYGGLLKKKNLSALDHKIQIMTYSDNPLKRYLGFYDLKLKQASSIQVADKKSIKVPALNRDKIRLVQDLLFKGLTIPKDKARIQKPYLWRGLLFISIGWIFFLGITCYFESYDFMTVGSALFIYMLVLRYLKFKKRAYSYNEDVLVLNEGSFGDSTTLVPVYKLQSLAIKQSLYQRRKGYATMVFYTASGELSIPYITYEEALEMFDYFTYIIESNKRPWI